MKSTIAALALACFSQITAAGFAMFGGTDCGKWMADKSDTRKSWLLGYMSGLSSMHEKTGKNDDPLDKVNSSEQIFLWMDNYCKSNPLNNVYQGGDALFIELMQKKR